MTYLTTHKILLTFFFISLTVQLFSQTEEFGLIKGRVIDANSGTMIIGANVFSKEGIGTQSDIDGTFEFEIPIGKHLLEISYIGYEDITKEVTVKSNDTLEIELSIKPIDVSCPWASSEPYAKLQGFWKPVHYINGNRKIDQSKRKDKAGIYFYFSNDTLPGTLSWNDGCYSHGFSLANESMGATYFRHIGNGIVEVQSKGFEPVVSRPRCSIINEELVEFTRKMNNKKISTSINNNGQSLSLIIGDEKFILHKIHNYTLPCFKTELIGTWKPVKGKLNRKKIRKFVDDAEVVFDLRNLEEKIGSVKYRDEECGKDHVNLTYRYFDEDFISFQYYSWNSKDKICNKRFLLGTLLGEFYKYGCNLKFNETKNVVTLQYGENFLMLKRKD